MKVELQHLTKVFPARSRRGAATVALSDLSLSIPDGKLLALLGPSGCGKSTVLNLICGLLPPTDGRILFEDEDVTDVPPESRGVGMVFQNYALYPHLTVFQNICFPLENLKGADKLPKEKIRHRAQAAAMLVQIEDLLDRRPHQLSGGQQQRVAIARALVKMPRILLMDEPLSNLDARLRLQTREEIRRIQQMTEITTIFVTHDQEEAMSIADCILVLRDGVAQQFGRPQEVYDDPVNQFVASFLGTPPLNLFDGEVRNGTLFIGEDAIFPVGGVDDGEVTVGIRPEGFMPASNGVFTCRTDRIETVGRDTCVIAAHKACRGECVRALIGTDDKVDESAATQRFHIRPHKLFLFGKENGERIRFTLPEATT